MKIKVESKNAVVIYELHDSTAAQDLIAQLPLEIEVEDYDNRLNELEKHEKKLKKAAELSLIRNLQILCLK